jgi:hypothetical protein
VPPHPPYYSMTKIDPVKIRWLIIALWIIPMALADVHLASNITTSDGTWSAYSEGSDHKLSASSEGGPSEYILEADLADALSSSVRQGLIAEKNATFSARSPEYTLRVRDASEFYGLIALSRESESEEIREIITEVPSGSLVNTTRIIHTTADIETSVRGVGSFSEDIDIANIGKKGRTLKLRELDGSGNFSLNTSLQLSGIQIKRDFGRLNESERLMDLGTELAYDHETGVGPMGGI